MDFYHVLNRGVEKRNIFMNDTDRQRFMQGLYLYNDQNILDNNVRLKDLQTIFKAKRKPLVKIHAYCLMDNHYHILTSPINDDPKNLSAFMRKLNMGYAKYFNEKYKRSGTLWQGKYKKIPIQNDVHFSYIPYYIHLNPLDKKFPKWRSGNIVDFNAAVKFLLTYKWSSFLDYQNIENYPSILKNSLLTKVLGNKEQQLKAMKTIISDPEVILALAKME